MPAAEVAITSFGFLHGPPPPGQHLVVDVRAHFRDPHFNTALRDLDATDPRVHQAVTTTRGITDLVMATALAVAAFRSGPVPGPVAVAVGCAGGRHRAAGIAIALGRLLDDWGIPASVAHRDIGKPRRGASVNPCTQTRPALPAASPSERNKTPMPDSSTSIVAPAGDLAAAGLVDIDAIEARALAAPGGPWEAYPDKVRIPWTAPDDETDDGRYIEMMRGDWHRREDVPDDLWPFLGTARDDVLALVALARWLTAALADALAPAASEKEEAGR